MTNLTKRIIPCLDLKDGRVVKGVNFLGLKDAGDPIEVARHYNDSGADELVFLDINASFEGRKTTLHLIESIAKEVFIPLSVGGGLRSLQDVADLLNAGCDKISLNSAALENPALISEIATNFGTQCVVVAVDAKKREDSSVGVFSKGGRVDSGKNLEEWLVEVERLGAGEILLTSMDSDGTREGFDLEKLDLALKACKLPLIASGGAGCKEDLLEVFQRGADAALAASIFHYQEVEIGELKGYLSAQGVPVRI